jgi:hypothetical protein
MRIAVSVLGACPLLVAGFVAAMPTVQADPGDRCGKAGTVLVPSGGRTYYGDINSYDVCSPDHVWVHVNHSVCRDYPETFQAYCVAGD